MPNVPDVIAEPPLYLLINRLGAIHRETSGIYLFLMEGILVGYRLEGEGFEGGNHGVLGQKKELESSESSLPKGMSPVVIVDSQIVHYLYFFYLLPWGDFYYILRAEIIASETLSSFLLHDHYLTREQQAMNLPH